MSQPTPEQTLFDPAPFTKGTPRQPREPRPAPAAVRVTERGWYAIARNGHPPLPLAHRVTYANPLGSVTTPCRIAGRKVAELEIGAEARLCPKCAGPVTP